jgi:hypothetical protein
MLGKKFHVAYSQAYIRLSQTRPFLPNMQILYCVTKLHARRKKYVIAILQVVKEKYKLLYNLYFYLKWKNSIVWLKWTTADRDTLVHENPCLLGWHIMPTSKYEHLWELEYSSTLLWEIHISQICPFTSFIHFWF